MKKKRILSVVLALAMLGTQAYAAEVRTEVEGTSVTIIAQTEANKKVNIVVSKKGELDDNDAIYEINQVKADATGKVTLTITIPEMRNDVSSYGEYDVLVKPEEEEMQYGEFAYVTQEDIDDLMAAITAQDADVEAILDSDSEWRVGLKAIGCVMSIYDDLSDKSGVIATIESGISAGMTTAALKEKINGAIAVEGITNAESADTMLKVYSPKFNNVSYVDFDSNRKGYVSSTISEYLPFASTEDFATKYGIVNALYEVNTSTFDKMSDTLDTYDDILGIADEDEYRDYLALSRSNKLDAGETLVKEFKKSYVTTVDKLLDEIEDAVAGVKKSKGSSGGGGGGTGFVSAGPAVVQPNQTLPGSSDSGNFTDLEEASWAKDAILALRDKGIVSGIGGGLFGPNQLVTREAFTKMIVMAAGLYQPGESVYFDDISTDDWCYGYVASAFNNKLVYGISETTFGKGSNISRQDMAVIAYRAAKDSGRLHVGREMIEFSDDSMISDYAREAVEALYQGGVLNGSDGALRPQSTATRAEASLIIYNLFVK